MILIQRLSWWEYHYSLLMIPLGILAVICIEKLVEGIDIFIKRRWKIPAYVSMLVILTLLFIPTGRRLIQKFQRSNQIEMIKIGERNFEVTGDAAADYKSISADTTFLAAENPEATMFVISNPLYYYLSDSSPLFASNGAMSDMFTDFEWTRLNGEMSERFPKYIFIETKLIEPTAEENPTFINTLHKNYSIYTTSERGSFYKLND